MLPRDIEDRTVYTILAKPVPRFEYVLGKLAGVLLVLAISTLVMSAMFLVVLYAREQTMLHEHSVGCPALRASKLRMLCVRSALPLSISTSSPASPSFT